MGDEDTSEKISIAEDAKDTVTKRAELESAKEKPENKTIVPRIKQFPDKVQPVLLKALENGQANASRVKEIIDTGVKLVSAQQKAREQVEQWSLLAASTIPPELKVIQDERLKQVEGELYLLQGAFSSINQGKDASELRSILPEGTFSTEEVKRFGETTKTGDKIKQALARMSRGYSSEKEGFLKKLKENLADKSGELVDSIEGPSIKYSSLIFEDAERWRGSSMPSLEAIHEYSMSLDQEVQNGERVVMEIIQKDYFLQNLEQWVTNLPDGAYLKPQLSKGIQKAQADLKNQIDGLRHCADEFMSGGELHGRVVGLLRPLISEMRDGIKNIDWWSTPIRSGNGSISSGSSISQEYMDFVASLQDTVSNFLEELQRKDFLSLPNGKIFQSEFDLGIIARTRDQVAEDNEALATSTDLLYHVAPFEVIKEILRKGVLASKKVQLDQFGEAVFNTGSEKRVKKEGDQIFYAADTEQKKTGNKSAEQEFYQLCFSENVPRFQYGDGVAFVFSKRSLFASSQFMEADGWHLFDKEYQGNSPDSPGFSIDLTTEPMLLIVVIESKKTELEAFIREELLSNPLWKDKIKDANDWIAKNILTIPESLKGSGYSEEKIKKFEETINPYFFSTHNIEVQGGQLMPSGEMGEDATRHQASLFFYRT